MAKLVDAGNPQNRYEPPIFRFTSMIPLERDAMKRGPSFRHEIHSEPHYSCPQANNRLVAYSAEIYEHPTNSANGRNGTGKGIILEPVKGMNLCLENVQPSEDSQSSVKVFCADESGVREIPMDGKILVRMSADQAFKILERVYADDVDVAVYVVLIRKADGPIRRATVQDLKEYANDKDVLFLLGPSRFPVHLIDTLSLLG